ncbi:hypothetical protein [uncultured Tateyamaria sp.]|uniref:hypothetical protein n=1 Tax=uncultured Tateyamaria sp. TaxID=455651 RepID=UPI002623ADDC|nr:hypothetical protein [uncultured Tateyamaria sp.]
MPRKTSKRRARGDTRTVSTPAKPVAKRPAVTQPDRQNLRTQVRGGRPPRFPGRTGGR